VKLGIVSCGIGNVGSVRNMLFELSLDCIEITKAAEVLECDRIILPGVGAFDQGVTKMREAGVWDVLDDVVRKGDVSVLGLCLGAELMLEASDEGEKAGFGWIPGRNRLFDSGAMPVRLPLPHMGWAALELVDDDPLFFGAEAESRYYFSHSYHFSPTNVAATRAWATYGYRFPAVIRQGRVVGVQFHPEKSRRFGAAVLRNFATGRD
jgi:glutamine amidotransferase